MGARLYYTAQQQERATLAVAEGNTDGLPSPRQDHCRDPSKFGSALTAEDCFSHINYIYIQYIYIYLFILNIYKLYIYI